MCSCGIVVRADGKERSTARRRGKEGQKGTAALRAAPPLENPAEGRLRRALRQALFRRPCAVSLAGRQGKGRSTTRARGENVEKGRDCPPVRMGGNGRAASVPRAAGERRTKGNGGAARSAAVGKSCGKPPQTSPTGSIVSAALQNPAEGRLGRAHRQASSRRPCKTPQKAASDEPNGKHRLGDSAKPRRKPPQTSPSASIASATLEKPAMFAPATRL